MYSDLFHVNMNPKTQLQTDKVACIPGMQHGLAACHRYSTWHQVHATRWNAQGRPDGG
jgi:hypothetical protein